MRFQKRRQGNTNPLRLPRELVRQAQKKMMLRITRDLLYSSL